MHRTAAELLGGDVLAGGGLHQRWAGQEDGALVFNDDGLVTHGRNVGATCSAGAHDGGQLRDTLGRQVGLVEEDATEVVAVREYVILLQQHRTAGIHQVDARKVVLLGDLLGTEVLLHSHRVVGTAGDGGVISGDHA